MLCHFGESSNVPALLSQQAAIVEENSTTQRMPTEGRLTEAYEQRIRTHPMTDFRWCLQPKREVISSTGLRKGAQTHWQQEAQTAAGS